MGLHAGRLVGPPMRGKPVTPTSAAIASARAQQRSGAIALAALKFGLAGCVMAFAGTLGSVIWKVMAG